MGLWEGEKDVWFDLYSRVGHVLVLGTTRVGKTRFLELQVTQDIRRGDTVIVFDPKGDAALLKRMYAEAKRAGRLDRFNVFHLGFPELSARYNGIGDFSRVTEIATRITNQLPQEGEGANFAQFVWGFGAVGNSMFSDLTSLAGRIYKDVQSGGTPIPKCSVHADEFNELIGDEFVPLLNKAGGAGYQVTVYTQTWSDIEARIGNKAKAGQISGNLNSVFMLRVKNPETAEILTKQLGKVWINTLTPVTGANDNNNPEDFDEFSSKNEDRINRQEVDLLTTADLTSLPKGQAYAYVEGRLYKLRLPLPDPADEEAMPESLAHMVRELEHRYEAHRYEGGEFKSEGGSAPAVAGEEHGVTMEGKGCGW